MFFITVALPNGNGVAKKEKEKKEKMHGVQKCKLRLQQQERGDDVYARSRFLQFIYLVW